MVQDIKPPPPHCMQLHPPHILACCCSDVSEYFLVIHSIKRETFFGDENRRKTCTVSPRKLFKVMPDFWNLNTSSWASFAIGCGRGLHPSLSMFQLHILIFGSCAVANICIPHTNTEAWPLQSYPLDCAWINEIKRKDATKTENH